MNMMSWKPAAAMLLGGIMLVLGCQQGDLPTLAPVEGNVTYQGQPLAQGEIIFYPSTGRPAYGKIKDGKIVEVTTLEANDGVTIGTNQVSIQSIEGGGDMYAEVKSLIPERYGNAKQSGLTAEIKQGQTNELKFELTD
ncbi:MAG: hypothetical protein ABIK89_11245 [Planctomycetota bacterium]